MNKDIVKDSIKCLSNAKLRDIVIEQLNKYKEELKEADEAVEYWQKECAKRSKVLDKIKEEYKNFNECDYNENNCEKLINKIKELLEEIE